MSGNYAFIKNEEQLRINVGDNFVMVRNTAIEILYKVHYRFDPDLDHKLSRLSDKMNFVFEINIFALNVRKVLS